MRSRYVSPRYGARARSAPCRITPGMPLSRSSPSCRRSSVGIELPVEEPEGQDAVLARGPAERLDHAAAPVVTVALTKPSRLLGRRRERLADVLEREAVRDQPVERDRPEVSSRIAVRMPRMIVATVAEVGVDELERHPVPAAQRELARAALVEADDRQLAAHAGRRRRAAASAAWVPVTSNVTSAPAPSVMASTTSASDSRRTSTVRVAPCRAATRERVGPRVGHDDVARSLERHELLDEVAHEARADDQHVVAERGRRELDRVDRAGERLRQRELERHGRRLGSSAPRARRRSRRSRGPSPTRRPGRPARGPRRPARPARPVPLTSWPGKRG